MSRNSSSIMESRARSGAFVALVLNLLEAAEVLTLPNTRSWLRPQRVRRVDSFLTIS
jgi:hypothetical protein